MRVERRVVEEAVGSRLHQSLQKVMSGPRQHLLSFWQEAFLEVDRE